MHEFFTGIDFFSISSHPVTSKQPHKIVQIHMVHPVHCLVEYLKYFDFSALEKLGYGDFRKDAEDALAECKEVADKRKRQNKRLDQMGVSQEELRRQQQELFAKARQEAAQQEQQIILQQQIQASKASTSSAAPAATATSSSSSDNNTNGGSNT